MPAYAHPDPRARALLSMTWAGHLAFILLIVNLVYQWIKFQEACDEDSSNFDIYYHWCMTFSYLPLLLGQEHIQQLWPGTFFPEPTDSSDSSANPEQPSYKHPRKGVVGAFCPLCVLGLVLCAIQVAGRFSLRSFYKLVAEPLNYHFGRTENGIPLCQLPRASQAAPPTPSAQASALSLSRVATAVGWQIYYGVATVHLLVTVGSLPTEDKTFFNKVWSAFSSFLVLVPYCVSDGLVKVFWCRNEGSKTPAPSKENQRSPYRSPRTPNTGSSKVDWVRWLFRLALVLYAAGYRGFFPLHQLDFHGCYLLFSAICFHGVLILIERIWDQLQTPAQRAEMASRDTKTLINLLKGQPSPSLLPAHLLKQAAQKVLSDPEVYKSALVYGPDPGYEPLRQSIAEWLRSFYQDHIRKHGISSQQICITGGASQNLGCMLNVYTDPSYTRNVWIVAPAYFLAFRIFEDAGFAGRMRAVPEDDEGVGIAFLKREMEKSEETARKEGRDEALYKPARQRAKVYKHVIYCVPTFSNPSSRTMGLERRRELVRLAREFDALVVADDVYDFLQWPASTEKKEEHLPDTSLYDERSSAKTAHLPRLVDVDQELDGGFDRTDADGFGNACSNGSFSKIAGPGIRVGWVQGSEKFAYGVSQTGTTCSGGAPSQLTSTYVHELVHHGTLQNFIEKTLRPDYASRYKTLMGAVEEDLVPLGFTVSQANRSIVGGYFTWMSLPEGLKAEVLASRCKADANVIIAAGSMFEVPGDESLKFERSVRLCWAYEDEWKLEEGVKRIGEVAKKMLEESENGGFVVVEKEGEDAAEFK